LHQYYKNITDIVRVLQSITDPRASCYEMSATCRF